MNMSPTVIAKSKQLTADDLQGGPRTVTITGVNVDPSAEQPVTVRFQGDGGKPYYPCKSMRRVMIDVWGADAKAYVGKSLTLYRDPKVTFGDMQVGGIRISHMSDMATERTIPLQVTKGRKKPYKVWPLTPGQTGRSKHADTADRMIEVFGDVQDQAAYKAAMERAGRSRALLQQADAAEWRRVEKARQDAYQRVTPATPDRDGAEAPADDGLDYSDDGLGDATDA